MNGGGGTAGVGFWGFGSMLAVTLSWSVNHSILWFHTNQQTTHWLGALPQIPAWGSMLRRLKGSAETHSNT